MRSLALLSVTVVAACAWGASAFANHNQLDLVTPGSAEDNRGVSVTADGRGVFQTAVQVSPADTDTALDVYEWSAGQLTLASVPVNAADGGAAAGLWTVSSDGSSIVFLQAGKTFRRAAGTTTLLCPTLVQQVPRTRFTTPDGQAVMFQTASRLAPSDTDDFGDIYKCAGGQAEHVSLGNAAQSSRFDDVYPDGRVWFNTLDPLVPEDTNAVTDLYEYDIHAETYRLVSPKPPATIRSRTPAGDRFWIETDQPLLPEDNDGGRVDVYLWRYPSGSLELLTTGPFVSNGPSNHHYGRVSPDYQGFRFGSTDQLTFDDNDAELDWFERRNGTTTLVPYPNVEQIVAEAGNRRLLSTTQALSGSDTDLMLDVYEDLNGAKTLLSIGPDGGNDQIGAYFTAASTDLRRVFFQTDESLFATDNDGRTDFFERFNGKTTWLSKGPLGGTGPFVPEGAVASADGARFFFTTQEALVAADTDGTWDTYVASVSTGGYPRPKAASPLKVSLVNAYRQCTAPDRMHGPPLAFGSCSSPVETSSVLTVGTGDANGRPALMDGYVALTPIVGDPATEADEADVAIRLTVDDVFTKALADYTGELRGRVSLRVTDRDSHAPTGGPHLGTVQDFPFEFDAGCAATADTQQGSVCAVYTSAEAVVPGAIKEGMRSNMQADQVQVFDGGPDEDGATQDDNTLFAVQGVFVP